MAKKIILLIIILNVFAKGIAQQAAHYVRAEEEKWLPKHFIHDIFQDAKGYMWIGTNAGLYKYNLHTLENINLTKKTTTQFLNNAVTSVAEDGYGNILVGTESGLGLLDMVSGNCTIISKTDETITKIKVEESGVVWWLTANGNLYKVSPLGKNQYREVVLFVRLRNKQWSNDIVVNTFDIKSSDAIWIGSNKGLLNVDKTNGTVTPTSLSQNITAILADKNERIWVGTSQEGLFFLEKGSTIPHKVDLAVTNAFANQITALKRIGENSILVSTTQNVFSINFDKTNFKATPLGQSLFSNREGYITTAFVDRTQNILLGSQIGLYKMKKKGMMAEYIRPDSKEFLPNNQINSLHYRDDGSLWIQTSMDGVFKMNPLTPNQTKLK